VAAGLGGGEGAVFLNILSEAASFKSSVPEAGAGRVQTSSVLLHDHTGH